ncbi:MAG TPA: UDP-N-acetylmuramate dehydrogenase [Candidatus Saccharimonadales bacterium]|nr:UDP-N-acetylmuramate dehydrogenase [Candidatus Saccharimonadales bacterium]
MKLLENVPLRDYTTMRLGGPARYLTVAKKREALVEAANWALDNKLPILTLGGGSNVIVRDEGFAGLVIVNKIEGFEIIQDTAEFSVVRIGAGENWDDAVAHSVRKNLSGIEALSLIPGSAGATPVQNVGAYGQEIADTFIELEAYDLTTRSFVTLKKDDCGFGYRTSIFKPLEGRRYLIASITLGLFKEKPVPPFYPRLQAMLDARHVTDYTPDAIRDAVIAIRTQRLPDPKELPNTGSFFKNPIVDAWTADELRHKYPNLPIFEQPDGTFKLPAGWLLEHAGLKDYADYGMRTFANNALVFINENAHNYQDLATFRDEVIGIVRTKYGITLEQEPELI